MKSGYENENYQRIYLDGCCFAAGRLWCRGSSSNGRTFNTDAHPNADRNGRTHRHLATFSHTYDGTHTHTHTNPHTHTAASNCRF